MTVTIRPREPEWITANIKTAIKQRKRLFKKAKRLNTANAWNKFKTKRNQVTTLLREQKKQYFEKLAADLRRNSFSSKSWYKTASKFLLYDSKHQDIPPLETQNGLIETDAEKADVLNDFFVQQSTVDDSYAPLPQIIAANHDTLDDIDINQQDVLNAIKDLDPNKALGPDLISPQLIKEGKNELAYPYSKLFNLSIESHRFPESFKKSNVTPIHKKDSRMNLNNYRPISLNSIQGKLMEKIVNMKINDYMTEHNIITPFQSGFRQGDSTTNQLLFLTNEFTKALDENKESRIVFCDISKAFDRVWHKGLLFKL